jgi:hypothetical protein
MTQMRRLFIALRENCHVPILRRDPPTMRRSRALGVAAVVPPGTLTEGPLRIVAGARRAERRSRP